MYSIFIPEPATKADHLSVYCCGKLMNAFIAWTMLPTLPKLLYLMLSMYRKASYLFIEFLQNYKNSNALVISFLLILLCQIENQ